MFRSGSKRADPSAVHITASPEETEALGRRLGEELPPNSILCCFGPLGAGKTTFIRGLVAGATGNAEVVVSSPTFVLMHPYAGRTTVYHFDLYRLAGAEEFLALGFDEYLTAGGVACLEWSERIEEILPASVWRVEFEHAGEQERRIRITPTKVPCEGSMGP